MVSGREVKDKILEGTPDYLVTGKKVLVLTPDATRTCPLPMMVRAVKEAIGARASRLAFMVALGTHQPLTESRILSLYGINAEERRKEFAGSRFLNHRWDRPDTFVKVGRFKEEEIEELTGGLFRETVEVDINRAVFEYDLLLVLGPVFPHEVVGFSGGNKYLFPGISGGDFLHFFHWLGAVITCFKTIGYKDTPAREAINRAAAMVKVPRHCISMVVKPGNELAGLFVGSPEEAWSGASDLSARVHVVYKKKAFHTVLGRAPSMYDEIWTAGKVMYKLEPVVAEGGRLIIYAPQVSEVSRSWGKYLERVGYHVRDYFLGRMDRFKDVPRGVLAHSTHVKGLGTYENGIERPRIEVILATSIPEDKCRKINLGYMNPEEIRPEDYQGREEEGILFVDEAGEILHRLERD